MTVMPVDVTAWFTCPPVLANGLTHLRGKLEQLYRLAYQLGMSLLHEIGDRDLRLFLLQQLRLCVADATYCLMLPNPWIGSGRFRLFEGEPLVATESLSSLHTAAKPLIDLLADSSQKADMSRALELLRSLLALAELELLQFISP